MTKLHVQSFEESDRDITFVLLIKDDAYKAIYGVKKVVVTKPLNENKLIAAITAAQAEVRSDTTDVETFVRSFVERKNRGDA